MVFPPRNSIYSQSQLKLGDGQCKLNLNPQLWRRDRRRDIAHNRKRASLSVPECTGCTLNRIHVVLVGWNQGGLALREALESLHNQQYPADRVTVWVHDDGSDEPSTLAELKEVCSGSSQVLSRAGGGSRAVSRKQVRCLRAKERQGPAGAKWSTFRQIREVAGPNDIILVIDGDDKLSTPKALSVINAKYIDEGVWCTYGSYIGKWSDQTKPIEGSDEGFHPRLDTWRYGHPRSFKAHLLFHMSKADFSFSDGTWLLKATDRGYVYRMLELSGAARVGYIEEPIYTYNYSPSQSTAAMVPPDVKVAHLDHVLAMVPSAVLQLPVHVVLVTWDRILLLPDQLSNLRSQSLRLFQATGRAAVLHIVNNNQNASAEVDSIVEHYCQENAEEVVCGSANPQTPKQPMQVMEILVRHQRRNWHAYQRFIYVAKLRFKVPLDSVIFIDDDQLWPDGFLLKMAQSYAPKTSSHWYGKNWKPGNISADYWDSEINMSSIRCDAQHEIQSFQYGGPGGAIFAADFWLFESELYRLTSDLIRFKDFDDLWVSYMMNSLLGWKMLRFRGPIPVDANDDEWWKASHTPAEIRKIRNAATYYNFVTHKRSTSKSDAFAELQEEPFSWNVRSHSSLTHNKTTYSKTQQ